MFLFKVLNIEWKILDYLNSIESDFLDTLNQILSKALSSVGIMLVLMLIYWCFSKEKAKRIAFTTFLVMILNNVIKGFVDRKRPFEHEGKEYLRKLETSKDNATSSSFPSGHAMNAAGFYSGIIFNYRSRRFRSIRIISVIAIIIVSITRIYLGVHFPSDVIFGVLFGVVISLIITFLQEILDQKSKYLYLASLIIFLPGIFLFDFDKDFYKSMGLLIGFVPAVFMEAKYVNFTNNVSFIKKIIRVIIGLILVGGTYLIYSVVPSELHDNNYFAMLMHALVTFVGIFIAPLIFSKIENK